MTKSLHDPSTAAARFLARARVLALERAALRLRIGDRVVGRSSELRPPEMPAPVFGRHMVALGWSRCTLPPATQNEYGDAARVRGWRHADAPRPRRGRAPGHLVSRHVPAEPTSAAPAERDPDVALPIDPRDYTNPRIPLNMLMKRLSEADRVWFSERGPAIEAAAVELCAARPAGQLTIVNLRRALQYRDDRDGLLVRELQHLGYEPLMHPPWREAHGFGPYQAAPWVRPIKTAVEASP